jgi:Flp pilus assembly pilin Flp
VSLAHRMRRAARREQGQTLAEYAALLSLLIMGTLLLYSQLADRIGEFFTGVMPS